jgi:Ca2+-binding RTX toxin-like protein
MPLAWRFARMQPILPGAKMTIHTWNPTSYKEINYVNGDTINVTAGSASDLNFFAYAGTLAFTYKSISPYTGQILKMYSATATPADLATLSFVFADGSTLQYAAGDVSGTGNIEFIIGSANANTFSGNAGNDRLDGRGGNDSLAGGLGNDTLIGGTGDDWLTDNDGRNELWGGDGNDMLDARAGDGPVVDASGDLLDGAAGNDVLFGGDGSDSLNGGTGDDELFGNDGQDSLLGSEGNDILWAGAGNDILRGFTENDSLDGGEGDDTLYGGAGNDSLDGGAGIDNMVGEGGADIYHVRDAGDTVYENECAGPAETDTVLSYIGDFTLGLNIEQGRIMHAGAANLSGNVLDNMLWAGVGDNIINGAAGSDTLSYAYGAAGGVTASLAQAGAQATGGSGSDTLSGIEHLVGSDFADALTGSAVANALSGGTGADSLTGGAGNDTLDGGAGADLLGGGDGADAYIVDDAGDVVIETNASAASTESDRVYEYFTDYTLGANIEQGAVMLAGSANLSGNALNNVLVAGAGDNLLDGSTGNDTASYEFGLGVTVSLALAGAQATGGSGMDTLLSFDNLQGSVYADNLTGNGDANVLSGGAGNDTLDGAAGNDTFDGGAGNDTVSYAASGMGVSLNLALAGAQSAGAFGMDTFTGIESLAGTAFADKLAGNLDANALTGGAGNDSLYGGTGIDTMSGGDGADIYSVQDAGDIIVETNASTALSELDLVYSYVSYHQLSANIEHGRVMTTTIMGSMRGNSLNNTIYASVGDNFLSGEGGVDTVSYAYGASSGVTVSLAIPATTTQATGGSGGDSLYSFENLVGSAYGDQLTGTNTANMLDGGAGNDLLDGGAGNDTLIGGHGIDTASYASAAGGVTVSLALLVQQDTGGAGVDTLAGIENVTGTAFVDKLVGNAAHNVFTGGAGNDTLYAGGGNDTVSGGDGADVYSVQQAGDVVIETNASVSLTESDLVYSYLANYTLTANVEQGRIMNAVANMSGNARDNMLFASSGNNTLDGAAGADTVSYAFAASSGVTLSLALAGAQATGGSGSDTLVGIEHLIGSAYADQLSGDGASNVLAGAAGADVLAGGGGADIFAYYGLADSGVAEAARDTISDFVQGVDKIDLSKLDANAATVENDAFSTFIGSADAFTAAGQLRVTDGVLYGNTDGDAAAEFAIVLTGITTLTIGDLIP